MFIINEGINCPAYQWVTSLLIHFLLSFLLSVNVIYLCFTLLRCSWFLVLCLLLWFNKNDMIYDQHVKLSWLRSFFNCLLWLTPFVFCLFRSWRSSLQLLQLCVWPQLMSGVLVLEPWFMFTGYCWTTCTHYHISLSLVASPQFLILTQVKSKSFNRNRERNSADIAATEIM